MTQKDFQNKRVAFKEGELLSKIEMQNGTIYHGSSIKNVEWDSEKIHFFYDQRPIKAGFWMTIERKNILTIKLYKA